MVLENKSPDAAYSTKDNIVLMDDTVALGNVPAAALAQHVTKMNAEATAVVARGALSYQGNVTGGAVKRGR